MRSIKAVLYTFISSSLTFTVILLLSCTRKHEPMASSPTAIRSDTTNPATSTGSIKSYLALGDSYTIGQSVPANERYPAQAVLRLRSAGNPQLKDADIIATSGWTTGDLLQAIRAKADTPSYDVVTLLIGVNNQYQGRLLKEYSSEFTSLLKRSIAFAGNRPNRVIVLSIPDYSVTPFAVSFDRNQIAREIDSFNIVNKTIADFYKVNYLNVTEESRKAAKDPTLIAYDGLHFSGKEYSIWTSMLVPAMIDVTH